MATMKQHKILLKKLKKQVRLAQKKEEQSRNQFRSAVKKMRKLARTYKNKLANKVRLMQGKIAAVQSSTYAKVADDLERQLMKGIDAKRNAIAAALAKIEKKHVVKLKKSVAKKGKKAGKAKPYKAKKASSVKVKSARRGKRGRPRKQK